MERLTASLLHLRAFFGGSRAVTITAERLAAYVRARADAQAAASTIRNELNALRRAFRLAKRVGRVPQVPEFPQLAVNNIRVGFFEREDFDAVVAELPEPLRPVVQFAYFTGWRIPSEVLRLQWNHVDFAAGVVRLDVGSTKNRAGRVFPFAALPALRALLDRQRDHTKGIERRLGAVVPWVFHRDGVPIRDFYAAWHAACRRAAVVHHGPLDEVVRPQLLGRVPHDLRRTAVRNLVRASVPERVAMQLTGHLTRSVFDRYDIVSERDLAEGVGKLATFHGGWGTIGGQSARSGA